MRVIVCGAGQVGTNIARYLSRFDTDVTVIDINPALVAAATDTLDVRGLVGHAGHPDTLKCGGGAPPPAAHGTSVDGPGQVADGGRSL